MAWEESVRKYKLIRVLIGIYFSRFNLRLAVAASSVNRWLNPITNQ
jgi:hypothetical protein